ncbi:MAG: hypothetical protein KKH92_02890 [Firmicutes bacterium]|nr:hypothetical protein [Bacillota bacterium]
MKCPKCKQEMLNGFIPVLRGSLYWLSEDQKLPWIVVKHPKNGVVLSDYTITTPRKADAYYCKPCKIVILPVKD